MAEVFWSLTPREFAAHKRLFDDRENQRAYTVAELQWALFVSGGVKRRDDPDHVWAIADFLPSHLRPASKPKPWQEMLATFTDFAHSQEKKSG